MKRLSERGSQPDTSGWLTRNEVAQFAGIGISTVIAHEKRGHLHPRREYRRDTRGAERHTALYDPEEVLKLPRRERVIAGRSAGETTARAFELFREGRTDEEVVIELRETFDQILGLREQWMDATCATRVIAPTAWEALEHLVGPFKSVSELVTKVAELRAATFTQTEPQSR
jgi:hypothetical protein